MEVPGLIVTDAPAGAPVLRWIDPNSISPNKNNWRIHTDDQRVMVRDLIKGLGWADVCLFNQRTGEFINGHLRRDISIEEGITSIPVLVGDWSPEEQATIHAALDLTTGMARTDIDKLKALIGAAEPPTDECSDILRRLAEKQGCEFEDDPEEDGDDTADDESDPTPEDAAEKIEALRRKWETAPGQVWGCRSRDGLRTHRVMIGDCTNRHDVEHLFTDIYASMIFTSPPYGNQRQYDGPTIDWTKLMCGFADSLAFSARDDAQILVNLGLIHENAEWCPYWTDAFQYMSDIGWRRFGWYVWDQGCGLAGMWHGRLAPSFEFIFHFNREMREPNQCVPCKHSGEDKIRQGYDHFRTGVSESHRYSKPRMRNFGVRRAGGATEPDNLGIASGINAFKIPDSVVRVSRAIMQGIAHLHPAIFPPDLPRRFIEAYSNDGDIIYDPFGGVLTTMLACEASGRVGYSMEQHSGYVAIGLERLSLAGLAPKRVS
jgi:DNA modification methylase